MGDFNPFLCKCTWVHRDVSDNCGLNNNTFQLFLIEHIVSYLYSKHLVIWIKDITTKINNKEEEVNSRGRDILTLAPSPSPSVSSRASSRNKQLRLLKEGHHPNCECKYCMELLSKPQRSIPTKIMGPTNAFHLGQLDKWSVPFLSVLFYFICLTSTQVD